MLVSYNSTASNWGKPLKSIQNLSIEELKSGGDVEALARRYKITEQSAIDFMTSIKNGSFVLKEGETVLQGYQAYLKSTADGFSHVSLKTKAFSTSMQVLYSIGLTALINGITWAFNEGIKAISNYIHRVELAQQVMKDINSEFNETQ